MSEKDYPAPVLAFWVWTLSMLAIAGWIIAAFAFVITRHP